MKEIAMTRHSAHLVTEVAANMAVKNLYAKTRMKENPYEVWESNDGWRWLVLKKYQVDDNKQFARWFCFVTSPFCPGGEYGDTYVTDITRFARCVQVESVR